MHELRNSIHVAGSSVAGGALTALSPLGDWLSRLLLGTLTGISVWLFTKVITHIHNKYRGEK